jgi:dimethylargininase
MQRVAAAWRTAPFTYRAAIVKRLSPQFAAHALRLAESNINQERAEAQHAAYIASLKALVPTVVELPADDSCPDCCFIEDTAVAVGNVALISRPGALTRRTETASTAAALRDLGLMVVEMCAPATLDGGDVLYTGNEFFVGLSLRTNRAGVDALRAAFPGMPVHAVPMQALLGKRDGGTLHLKSVMSMVALDVVAFADTDTGRALARWMAAASRCSNRQGGSHKLVWLPVPEPAAANAVIANGKVLVRAASEFPRSSAVIRAQVSPALGVVEVSF